MSHRRISQPDERDGKSLNKRAKNHGPPVAGPSRDYKLIPTEPTGAGNIYDVGCVDLYRTTKHGFYIVVPPTRQSNTRVDITVLLVDKVSRFGH